MKLKVEKLNLEFSGKEILHDISFSIQEREFVSILGPSGCGKSTFLKTLNRMNDLVENVRITGEVKYDGKDIFSSNANVNELRKEIGMVFQDCKAALCPVRTIGAQIYEAVSEHEKISKKEVRKRAGEIMKKIGLDDSDRVLDSYPFELSGGMNQRVGICTAMILHPNLLLADEPTSALDVTVQKQVAEELLFMRKTYNTAMILVTHNIGVVRMMADRILVLQNGQAREYGETEAVLDHPKDPYTKKLMSSVLHLKRAENQEVR